MFVVECIPWQYGIYYLRRTWRHLCFDKDGQGSTACARSPAVWVLVDKSTGERFWQACIFIILHCLSRLCSAKGQSTRRKRGTGRGCAHSILHLQQRVSLCPACPAVIPCSFQLWICWNPSCSSLLLYPKLYWYDATRPATGGIEVSIRALVAITGSLGGGLRIKQG